MTNRFSLLVLVAAVAIIVCAVWEPARQRVGLLSVSSSAPAASPSPSPSSTPQDSVAVEQEPAVAEQTPAQELPGSRFAKCLDGTELRVIANGINGDGASYKCASGADGAYLSRPPSQ